MVNAAPIISQAWNTAGLAAGILLGYAIGLPVKLAIIRKWSKRVPKL